MRLRIASLRRPVKGDLRIEFVPQDLTSYGGVELLRRYFRLLDLHRRLRRAFSAYGLGGDYRGGRLVLLVMTLFVVGARRVEHLRYLAHDPLVARLCGLVVERPDILGLNPGYRNSGFRISGRGAGEDELEKLRAFAILSNGNAVELGYSQAVRKGTVMRK